MSDRILETIAEALGQLWTEPDDDRDLPDWQALPARLVAALKSQRIQLVELPEPSYVDEPEAGLKGYGFNGGPAEKDIAAERGVYAYDGQVYDQWDGVTAAQARTVGSWWLAAAEAAETKP